MFVIIVYDMGVERVTKICQYLRRSMDWVQNSVFEGELTDAEFKRIQHDVKELMEADVDSVRFYTFRTKDQVKIETLGVEKADIGCIV
ncbi:MAG: CRISPR-associated endonuclease Cas2 [Methanomicrobia archaeon]|nr:CRISPR-associated endonuclease Cas2 [Methanomicrobia archaeon]